MIYKLGSLFDGSGGFPLAGALCGIEPVWAAEVEPYPIAVTRSRFPNMKHLGDISKVSGAEIEPVDIITFGSPCQDLSVAGKRAGLKHEANGDEETTRSGLFMEAVRIIKEMRTATNEQYPRFAIWENVPGAFSSNNGEDFRVVCEELIKIVEPSASMPSVPKGGWNYADSYIGDGWSLAYRVFDAQYWGVPQRRRRIYLVADLRGERAREVLFEREGLRGYFAEGRTPWQTAPADAQGSTGADDQAGEGNRGNRGRLDAVTYPLVANTLTARADGSPQPDKGNGAAIVCMCLDAYNQSLTGDKAIMMSGAATDPNHIPSVVYNGENIASPTNKANPQPGDPCHALGTDSRNYLVYCLQGNGIDRADTTGCNGKGVKEDICYTLNTIDRPAVAYGLDRASFNQGKNAQFDFSVIEEQQPTLTAKGPGAVCVADHPTPKIDENGVAFSLMARDYKAPLCTAYPVDYSKTYQQNTGPLMANSHPGSYSGQDAYTDMFVVGETTPPPHYIVRRLTPTECARLQGFADWWGIVEPKDTFTEAELRFWLEVRNTHARINGKKEQDYTAKQMLTWYNKLWTDSAEYKMWGNGIALPTALYCVQGVVDVLSNTQEDDADDWMN